MSPTQIGVPIGVKRVTCRGSKLTNCLGKHAQQHELLTSTWSGRAPWNRDKFMSRLSEKSFVLFIQYQSDIFYPEIHEVDFFAVSSCFEFWVGSLNVSFHCPPVFCLSFSSYALVSSHVIFCRLWNDRNDCCIPLTWRDRQSKDWVRRSIASKLGMQGKPWLVRYSARQGLNRTLLLIGGTLNSMWSVQIETLFKSQRQR